MTLDRATAATSRRGWPTVCGVALAVALAGTMAVGSAATTLSALPRSVAAQEAAPTTARVVPETAPLYLALNLDLESAQWRQVETLLTRVGFPTVVDDVVRDLERDLAEDPYEAAFAVDDLLGGELGVVVTEAAIAEALASATAGMPTGRGSFAEATPFPAAGTPLPSAAAEPSGGFALVLEASDPDATFAALAEEMGNEAERDGGRVEEIAHRGVEILALPGDEYGGGMAIARLDEFVLFAESPVDVEPLIDTAAGETAALADAAPMADVLAALHDETALFGFVNGERVGDALGDEVAAYLEAVSPGVGASALDLHLGFALWADEPGLRLDTIALPLPGGSLPPLPSNAETTLDRRVSADNLFFVGGADLGANGALDALALLVATTVVQELGEDGTSAPTGGLVTIGDTLLAEDVEAQFAAAERVLGFDLRADLFDQPVGEFALSGTIGDLLSGQGFTGLFASDVRQPAVVAGSLRRVARLIESTGGGAVDVSTRQVAGDTVFVARSVPTDDFSTGTPPTVEFGVVDDQVVIGLGPGVDDYVDGPANALADDERYRRVMATLPEEHNQVAYVNLGFFATTLRLVLADAGAAPGTGEIVDADPACAAFATQVDAQAAYEADPIATGELDQDFDDEACEDFFAGATPAASPATVGDPSALEALATVGATDGETYRSSTILFIAEP